MPERLERLREIVDELERELEGLESVDPETSDLLQEATREIQDVLKKEDADSLEHESLADRLNHAAENFQATHPTLAGITMRMVDALRQLGI